MFHAAFFGRVSVFDLHAMDLDQDCPKDDHFGLLTCLKICLNFPIPPSCRSNRTSTNSQYLNAGYALTVNRLRNSPSRRGNALRYSSGQIRSSELWQHLWLNRCLNKLPKSRFCTAEVPPVSELQKFFWLRQMSCSCLREWFLGSYKLTSSNRHVDQLAF